jgi:hypothetical protein
LPKLLSSKSRDRVGRHARHAASQRRPQRRRSFLWIDAGFVRSTIEARADRHPIPNRLSTGVRDHDKLNLDRLFANSRHVGHLRCESVPHKASYQLMGEAMGKHQGLGDATRNVGKPLQGTAFVDCHGGLPSSIEGTLPHMDDTFAIPATSKFMYGNKNSWRYAPLKQLRAINMPAANLGQPVAGLTGYF